VGLHEPRKFVQTRRRRGARAAESGGLETGDAQIANELTKTCRHLELRDGPRGCSLLGLVACGAMDGHEGTIKDPIGVANQ
jgi:hypothetical protein